jgi:hypothetical protein
MKEELMRRIALLTFLFILMFSFSVHAIKWQYPFVVWKGKVYEVKQEEIISDSEIGSKIGEVKKKPNNIGNYYGDASNYYPKGTKYYEIIGISTSNAIAVKEENQMVKAVFVQKVPFHIMNIISNPIFFTLVGVIILIIIRVIFSKRKANN